MEDNLIANKLADLQQYIPFLTQVINNLKNNTNDKPRPQQLQKMEMLFSLITNSDKKPLKLETLVKCETVVHKIYNKIEKQKDDSSNSSPATVDSISMPMKTTDNQEIIEIMEPDSPPVVEQRFHASPIVIPTEREESPPPSLPNNLPKGRKNCRWDNPNREYKRDDEIIDNNCRKRIPTIDKSRNRNNESIGENFDRSYDFDYGRLNENEIYDNRRSRGFETDRRNFERNPRCEVNNGSFDISTTSDLRNLDYQNERYFEKIFDRRNRYINDEISENEFYKRNDNFQQHNYSESRSFSEHLQNMQHDTYYRENIRHNPEESPFSEWLKTHNSINQERYDRESIDYHKTTYDYKHERNINHRESPSFLHSQNHFRRDFDCINRQDNSTSNWGIEDESADHGYPSTSISFDKRRIQPRDNLVQVPIKKEQASTMRKNQSNEQPKNSRTIPSYFLDNIPKSVEEPDNSIFNRLGNKIDISENFQIKVKNDRASSSSKAPLIKDVLKSPPLSAHDIDELYHESGGEVDNNFDTVRKKLAKISCKLKDDNLNTSPMNLQPSIKSPDPNRLAYKYNPHPRISLDDPLSPKSFENTFSKSPENGLLKSPSDPRLQKQIQTANTLPSVNPNDPRLKTWCIELNTQNTTPVNHLQIPSVSAIPSLLDLNIPPIFDYPIHNNDVLSEPLTKPVDSVDNNLLLPVNSSLETTDSLNYKKFHPLLNDQVERIKYLESKKNKPNTETTKKGTTSKELRQKTEEDKDNKRDSFSRSTKINKDKLKDISKNNDRDRKTKDSGKNWEPTTRDTKYDKSKANDKRRNDNMGNTSASSTRNDGNKTVPNCLDSMYRTSNYKKDLGSVASFKIPKKGKEEDKSKTIEKEIIVDKSNINETSKFKELSYSVDITKENSNEKIKNCEISSQKLSEASGVSVVKTKESESNTNDDVEELNDNKIQPINRLKDEKIKINLLKKSSEVLSPPPVEQDSDDNWVVLSEIGTENPNEESIENEEMDSVTGKETSEVQNLEHSNIIEKCDSSSLTDEVDKIESIEDRKHEVVSKPLRSRRKSVFDIVVTTSDNSEVSTQNIISGKRRNRSSINLNENLLAISKVQIAAAEAAISDQAITTPIIKKLSPKSNPASKAAIKKKRQNKIAENLLPKTLQKSPSISSDAVARNTTAIEDPPLQASVKKEEISKDSLESFLLDMFNPSKNKSRVLGMLEKVLDENKFQQVKKIIEDDDTDNKKVFVDKKEEETKSKINKSQLNVYIPESSVESAAIVKQESPGEKRKQKKKLTELDRLNVDIRDMFISEGVITATGRRMCTMMKAAAEERDVSVNRPPSRLQSLQSKSNNTTKKKRTPNIASEYTELPNLNKVPKVVLSKVDISTVGTIVSTTKNRTNSRRRKRVAWSKGIISRKSKKLPASKKQTDAVDELNKECDKKEQNTEEICNVMTPTPSRSSTRNSNSSNNCKMPVLKPVMSVKDSNTNIWKEKPCPKSKKKYNFSNDDNNILIRDEPIIDNVLLTDESSIFIDPSMPILATITPEKISPDLPKPHELINVSKLKNIYSGMHAKSEYSNKCVLCKFTGSKVANHYTAIHPNSEVFISRLPPDTLKDLLASKNNSALYSFRKQQCYVYHYRCPFCDIQQSFSRKSWIDHFSTHTGEYAYKCSNCSRSMNMKQSIMSHFQNVCPNGEIVLRPSLSKDIRLVEAFVCKICNYVQMVEKNVVKHLKDQHDILNDFDSLFNRIILINIQSIPLLDGNEEQEQAALAATIPKTTMDFIDPSQTETDKLDAFVPKEQDDLSFDKNFLNYMDDMSFSNTESTSQILGKSSIIDQLSERLQSSSGDNSINCSGIKPILANNRRYSIADQLSKRFKNADEENDGAQGDNNKVIRHSIESCTHNEGSQSPIPVVYILDNLDDDIDNVELAESSEQLIVPVDKPISVARANKLNEMMNDSNRNSDCSNSDKNNLNSSSIIARLNERFKSPHKKQSSEQLIVPVDKPISVARSNKFNEMMNDSNRISDSSNSDKNNLNSSSIIARLNERFKSPQKKQINKCKEVLQEKTSIRRPGTMIIDRLNKRLNSIDDREKPDNGIKSTNSSQISNESSASTENTQNESDDLMDTSDDKLVIDESYNEETILNEVTGILQPARKSINKNEVKIPENSAQATPKDSELESLDTDDDDWEDIEIMPANFDMDTKSSNSISNNSAIDKNKNGTFYQTLSRLYAASLKPKNKSLLKNKKSLLKNKVIIEENKLCKKSKFTDSIDVSCSSPVSYRLPDLVTDAIPSPVSNELSVNPPVPLPSEPLSDLNDISEILEPSTTTEMNTNNDNVTLQNLGSPIDLCNIDDDDIFILNDESNIEDALALAAEIENTGDDSQNELVLVPSPIADKLVSLPINDKTVTAISTTTDSIHLNSISINKDEIDLNDLSGHTTKKYRIDKLGFSITNGKIKYLCLVNSCSFLYSELEFGLENHFIVDHSNLTWDGFCHTCESIVCFDRENFGLTQELKHMTEIHINNIKKNTTIGGQVQNISIPEKPKISLRRLSGDMLSAQPTSTTFPKCDSIQQLIEAAKLSCANKTISSPQVVTNNPLTNLRIPQNISIKKLLNTPSVPPPLPVTLTDTRSKSPIIPNNQLAKDFVMKNRSLSIGNTNDTLAVPGNVNKNSLLKKNLDTIKVYSVSKKKKSQPITQGPEVQPSIVQCPAVQQPIKNNTLGGSNLVIASVAEGVRLPTPVLNTQVTPPNNELMSRLKIQSVCSLNSQQTELSTPATTIQENNNINVPTIQSIIPTKTTEPVIGKQIPLTTTIIPSSSNSGSIIVGKQVIDKSVQPWFHSSRTKPSNIVQLQLRAISLYAFYKCMSSNCFFTTNCPIKLKKHFICHEFSGATTNKSSVLESIINYRDWLSCAYCNYHAETTEKILEHLKEIHLNDIYQCPYCFYRSCCECNVQQHQKNYHVGNKPLIYVAFGDRKKLALEIRFLAKNRAKYIIPIPCNDCPKQFYLLRNYFIHLQQVHDINSDYYICGICKNTIHKKSASYHLSATHNISIYQCIYCSISSNVRSRMIVHMTDDHPSNLLYSCVRVTPNKYMRVVEETIENSTVLANLSEPVDPSILVECKFTLEQLNFMSPSLDAKSLQDNRTGTAVLTNFNTDINKSSCIKTPSPTPPNTISKNLKINVIDSLSDNNTLNSSTSIDPTINSSNNTSNLLRQELLKSPTTLKISSIIQSCPKLMTGHSTLKSIITTTKSAEENITKSSTETIEINADVLHSILNNDNQISSIKVATTCNEDNLNDRIVKAAKELVQDTGYEGYDLYRCAYAECINIKITELTLFEHIQEKHSRVRSLKCPHCTAQYQSSKTLRHHLNTHRMHRYFCYFCNYTAITQQIILKHINDSHSKNNNIKTVILAYTNNSNSVQNIKDDCFYLTCPSHITTPEISQFGERLIRICERKKSLTKKTYKPDEIDQLPIQSIFHNEVICGQCNYKTKVRINMYRHLLYHTKEIIVPSIDPVNPVPCLNTNEKHYDKMRNLACSSNINKNTNSNNDIINNTTTTTKSDNLLKKSDDINNSNNVNNTKSERKIPIFIPSMRRYVCGVNGCNYLTITDSMLKHHLNALHLTERSYKCPHCKIECVKKSLCPDKLIQHLKFHDAKIFVCSECSYMHYQKYLVDRHIYDKHPNKTIDLIRYERKDTDTTVYRQTYCGTFGDISVTTNNDTNKITSNNTKCTDDDMSWECTICKHRTVNSIEMSNHVSSAHNIRFRYACLHCKFGAGQFKTVMEHINDKHPTKNRKVKCAFNRIGEIPVVTEDFLQQDNRPLWSRGDPHRVKNIRGILMEEEDENTNTSSNSFNVITTISNNILPENISKKLKPQTITKSREREIDVHNKDTIITEKLNKNSTVEEKSKINETTDPNNKMNENFTNISNIDTQRIDIYECSYCPVRNISFKTIYTHWMLHHCEKSTVNKNPLLSKPFSFKLWGVMSQDSSTEIELPKITANDLQRLQRLGQKATRFQCNECWRLFANSSSVTLHQESEHNKITNIEQRCLQYKNITFYICNFCGYSSSMQCKTAAHLLNHYGGFKKCHLCNVKFEKFLEFVSHLIKHQITFSDFIENDSEIITFWNQIKILYPNGLCIQRGSSPNDLNNKVLETLVIEQINNAILTQDGSKDPDKNLERDKTPITNKQNDNNNDSDTVTVLSIASESESFTSTNTVTSTSTLSNNQINKLKIQKKTKKRAKDNEWIPGYKKRRKIEKKSDGNTESDDDLIPLKYLTDDNKATPLISTDNNNSTIVVPKRKPGPKCMQQTPYSFYGVTTDKLDLKKIYTTMQLGNDKPVVVTCENFARFVNINPRVYLQKVDINNINDNDAVVTYKRKLSHLINNIIDEELGYSTKKIRET